MVGRAHKQSKTPGFRNTSKAKQKWHAKPLSGFVAWQQAAKEMGLNVKLPRCGSARSQAFAEWKAALPSKVVVEGRTNYHRT